jgi:hypothetical protein
MKAHSTEPHAEGLSPRVIELSAILWPSFLVAGLATMVFFAFIDPHELNLISFPSVEFSRELGYSIGFFLLWLSTAAASYLTALLLRKNVLRKQVLSKGSPP